MNQQQNPQPPSPPQPVTPSPVADTKLGKSTKTVVMNVLEFVDQLFYGFMGELGRTVYASIQDAIALSILLQVPGLIGKIIIGKDFSSFDVCLKENPLGASCYACFIIVTSDFLLWIVLAGRIIARFCADIKNLRKKP
ncbi:hypothetical protein A0J48_009675 [Sphaerospermopsis aphanizomenoides BCCUSP55]|uniref:hypothetical protein n=1 Tax=Sphaerospermopsis aphanizomenoides TaxID=459663 RepID=UPI001906CA89|nr:hypothetical protein [Sphaerospermopsis aphanizomenoides]MBK1987803.1 hypothetical protein [Sphaerospermopsis aphanizomenoides BCCUSP55]